MKLNFIYWIAYIACYLPWGFLTALTFRLEGRFPLGAGSTARNLMKLAGFEALETHRIVLFPKYVPLLSTFLNRFCARLPLLNRLCMTEVVVARLLPTPVSKNDLSVSVIIPCKDEKGNVEAAVRRMPQLSRETEIIFCDDQSSDGTADESIHSATGKVELATVSLPGEFESITRGFVDTGKMIDLARSNLRSIPRP